ncbi:MAG: hypothetical protein JKY56_27885 [Kofleriaceae bacterium]|nr:hypothetical protein [Kofleriaceae bacterium]
MERPQNPGTFHRSRVYLNASQVKSGEVYDCVRSFFTRFGELVDLLPYEQSEIDFKKKGLLAVAVIDSADWICVLASAPRSSDWSKELGFYSFRHLNADVFCYWTSTPKQDAAESYLVTKSGPAKGKKSESWKKVVAAAESYPHPYLKIADLPQTELTPPPELFVVKLDLPRFEHALEFGGFRKA